MRRTGSHRSPGQRGVTNGVQGLEILNAEQVRALEPNVAAVAALHSPNTGIVDYAVVTRSFARDVVESKRGAIFLDFNVEDCKLQPDHTVRVTGCELGQKVCVRVCACVCVCVCVCVCLCFCPPILHHTTL